MYGYDKNYKELLEVSQLQPLKVRRDKAIRKFAAKMYKNDNYSDLFPLSESTRSLRKNKKFQEEYARTEKLYNSPLFKMRRLLNEICDEERDNNVRNYLD